MPMNVEIRVDAPQALPMIAAVEAGLAKVESHGPAVGTALGKGFGDGATAADKAKQSTQSLAEQMAKLANTGSAFTGLADVFKRQGDMLDKIRGPAKEYTADLQALDMLLQNNAITTSEYATQVTRMNQAIDGTKQSTEEAANPAEKLGGMLAAFAAPEIAEGIIGIGEKINGLIENMHRAEDQYIELTNKSLKFVDASHSTNQVLDEQQAMSLKLNTTIGPMLELYEKVTIGADGMRLSHEQLLRMEQTVAEGASVSNKSIEDATSVLERFSFAMESGVTNSRDIKRVMVEMPELAGVWRDAFHTTDAAILSAVEHGTLGARQLATAWAQSGSAVKKLDEDQLARTRTNEVAVKEYAESLNRLNQSGTNSFSSVLLAGMKPEDQKSDYAMRLKYGNDADARENGQQGQAAIDSMMKQAQEISDLSGRYAGLGNAQEAVGRGLAKLNTDGPAAMNAIGVATDTLLGKVTDLFSELGKDPWSTSNPFAAALKIIGDHNNTIDAAKERFKALTLAMKDGGFAGDAARKEYESLMTTLNDGRLPATIKIFDSLHEPMRTFQEDSAAVNVLWKEGTRSALDYQYELLQLAKTDPGLTRFNEVLADSVKRYDAAAAAAKRYADAAKHGDVAPAAVGLGTDNPLYGGANRQALSDFGTESTIEKSGGDKQTEAEKRYQQVIDATSTSVDKYYDELIKVNSAKSLLSTEQYATAVANLNEKYGAAVAPAEKFNKEIDELNGLFGAGALTFIDYTRQLQAIGKEQEKLADSGKDFTSGLSRGWHSIRDEVNDTASVIASSMKGAFDEINADIVSMVTTGTADWSKFATTIETDLTKIALQKVEASAISYIGGAIGSSWAGSDTTIPGSWAGSDTMIHAANGYSGRVGGAGGVDTKLFAAMVSPGETVSIRTQEQQKAEQGGRGGNGPINVHYHDDTKAQLKSYMSGGDTDTELLGWAKRSKGALQSLLGR